MRTHPQKLWLLPLLICLFLALMTCAALADGAQISGTVYIDRNNDGAMQSNEKGLQQSKVVLQEVSQDGSVRDLASKTVGADGAFAFAVNQAGDYRLYVELPAEYYFTLHGEGSCILPSNSRKSASPVFSLSDGESRMMDVGGSKVHANLVLTAYVDNNANGGRAENEPLLRGVVAELTYEYEGTAYTVATAKSDRSGVIYFRDLSPATYTVRVTLPENYVIGPKGERNSAWYNSINANEDGTGVSDALTLLPGHNMGLAVGAVKTGSLEGNLWLDENFNGMRDSGEVALTDATILLISPTLALTRETTPDAQGHYSFRNVQPGEYKMGVQLGDGLVFTYPEGSAISVISSYGETAAYVNAEKTFTVKDIGAMPAASVALRFFKDDNLNGALDEGEAAVPGVAVSVSQMGQKVESRQSGEDGQVSFSALRSGDVEIDCTLPEGYVFELNQDLPQGLFGIATATAINQYAAAISVNDNNDNAYDTPVALTVPAAIRGQLFEDPVNAGLLTDDCDPLPGFTVQAVAEDGQIAAQAVTDIMGQYTLYPLHTGEYTVRFLLNDPYVASPNTKDNDIAAQTPEYGETASFPLAQGQAMDKIDGAVFRAGVVQGRVINALADGAENAGIRGVTVELQDPDGMPVSDYTYGVTGEDGAFLIKGVLPGEYVVHYALPDTAAFADGDAREEDSEPFSMTSGSEQRVADIACIYTATLAGRLIQDADTPATAWLTLKNTDSGDIFETEVTPDDGEYMFTLLRPGNYVLDVELPAGCVFGELASSPLPPKDDQSNSASFALAPEEALTADIRAAKPVDFSGEMYFDANLSADRESGEQPAANQTLNLYLDDTLMRSVTSDENGRFTASGLVPAEYTVRMNLQSNEVLLVDGAEQTENGWWFPLDLSDDTQLVLPMLRYAVVTGQVWNLDHSTSSVDQIEVSLLDENGSVLGSILTDGNGAFGFSRLLPGVYTLSAKLPSGYLFAKEQDTADRASMILSQSDGGAYSIPFTVPMGKRVTGMDIGIGSIGKIGDKAWLDTNGNGMQDIGETGMPGIRIELYRNGELAASATTDLYGRYSIDNLYPGEYEMRVTMHKELKPTKRQTAFPLVASIMPESSDTTVTFSVIVPSGGANLHCDLGFVLRKDGVYPSVMDEIPAKDWTPYSERTTP